MKTSFKAKIIFDDNGKGISFNMLNILEWIKNGNADIEIIDDQLTNDIEPIIIFTLK